MKAKALTFSALTVGVGTDELEKYLISHHKLLEEFQNSNHNDGNTGWVDIKRWANRETLEVLKSKAEEIQSKADVFVVVGVGGSNQAARAAITALAGKSKVEIVYAGNTLSAYETCEMLDKLKNKSVYINVIAKNFETLEPGLAFRLLRRYLYERYAEGAAARITCTGTTGSHLHAISQKEGYTFLAFPDDTGGRYSAISNVGLLPMAVAGIDIDDMVDGAEEMSAVLRASKDIENQAFVYAAMRNILYNKGYRVEMLSVFEPRLRYLQRWWVQLFAESEGKDSKGIFPVSSEYSEDLHSVGQFVQEGSPMLFETFLDISTPDEGITAAPDAIDDGFGYLDKMFVSHINRVAQEATIEAHNKRLPCIRISLNTLDAYSFGQMLYFFEFSCSISGSMLKVNPFDQPGVEAYKDLMFRKLGK